MTSTPRRVRIVEVGPRDGLQNEATSVPTETKLSFITQLVEAGLAEIEATSFVHPQAVPQLADAAEIAARLPDAPGVRFSALVPNARGLERALAAGFTRIAVFTAASDAFTERNIRMSVAESLEIFAPVVEQARASDVSVRGYVSTAFVCPYAGEIDTARVVEVAQALDAMGCEEIAISDTIGAAAPTDIERVLGATAATVPIDRIALHLHDTYGTALANVSTALRLGVTTFDASAGGFGGCPHAPGASGNLATEDLAYLLGRMGIETGVNLEGVCTAAATIAAALGRDPASRNFVRLRGAGAS